MYNRPRIHRLTEPMDGATGLGLAVGDDVIPGVGADLAKGETFNLTNGEVFSWRDMWPAIANTLNVDPGPDESLSIAGYLAEKASLWADIVVEHNLADNSLESILGESHYYADLCLACGLSSSPPATFVSTIKIKQAGFTQTYDSEASFCFWLRDLQARKIIPV